MVSGESHYFSGQRYRLRVCAADGAAEVVVRNALIIELHVRLDASIKTRQKVMTNWYRQHLKDAIPPLLEKWQKRLGVKVSA
jgi:predicted metal-dependent hydrolase